MKRHHLPCLLLPIFLLGCNALPVYQSASGESMAKVRVLGPGVFSMCKDGVIYKLPIEQPNKDIAYIQVPTGKRIGLSAFLSQHGYQRIIYCSVGLSFIPQAGQAYVSNDGYRAQQCFIELVRQDDTRETGVAQDLTVDFYQCATK